MDTAERQRMDSLSNRLWHADGSFNDPRGRYSMLHARAIRPVPASTEFTDLRAAYDALPPDMKTQVEGLSAQHSLIHSLKTLGYDDFTPEEEERLKGAVHPLVHDIPSSGRTSLYIGAHASRIVDYPIPEGRLLLLKLRDHAVQSQFCYTHVWAANDLVVWDNRATMHRVTPTTAVNLDVDVRLVMTLDLPRAAAKNEDALLVGAAH